MATAMLDARHKRPAAGGFIPHVDPKRQRTPEKTTLLFCKVLIDSNWLFQPNDFVYLNEIDYQKLDFTHQFNKTPPYILISNTLFRVAKSIFIPQNTILMSRHQAESISAGTFKDCGSDVVSIATPWLPQAPFVAAARVRFELVPEDSLYEESLQYKTVHLGELNGKFKELLIDRFVVNGQKLVVKMPSGLVLTARVTKVKFAISAAEGTPWDLPKHRYLYINQNTTFDYTLNGNPAFKILRTISPPRSKTTLVLSVTVINKNKDFEASKDADGKVQVTIKSNFCKTDDTLLLPHHTLTELIRKNFVSKFLYPGYSSTICISEHQSVLVTCERIVVKNLKEPPKNRHSPFQQLSVMFDEAMPLTLKPDSTIQLVNKAPVTVKSIAFIVKSVLEDESPSLLQPHRSHIIVKEFERQIHALGIPFVADQKFQLTLSTGVFRIKVLSANKKDAVLEEGEIVSPTPSCSSRPQQKDPAHVKQFYAINDTTKIKLFSAIPSDVELVQDWKTVPLKRIQFKLIKLKLAPVADQVYQEDLARVTQKICDGKILPAQNFHLTSKGVEYRIKVKKLIPEKESSKSRYPRFAEITPNTKIEFTPHSLQTFQVVDRSKIMVIANANELMEEVQLGGISKQANEMIRRALLPRGKLSAEAKRRNIAPLKGILLYGPPGTGKSTLAKQIGKLFDCTTENKRLKMVNASEVFGQLVGDSEQNVRDLFKEARKAFKKFGPGNAPLHIIVADELEGAFATRGDRLNRVNNSVVTQLLGELEGLNSPDNVLFIGITNRKQDIDPALLRNGRLGLHLEFALPNAKERREIFEIHTAHLKRENLLDHSVDFAVLANQTVGYSGADIKDLCDEASICTLERLNKAPEILSETEKERLEKVRQRDFIKLIQEKNDKKIAESSDKTIEYMR